MGIASSCSHVGSICVSPNDQAAGDPPCTRAWQVDENDRILFSVKDHGLVSAEYSVLGFGPKIICQASLPVGEDFDGYLELETQKEIPQNGRPLLQVVVKFCKPGCEFGGSGVAAKAVVFEGKSAGWRGYAECRIVDDAVAQPSAPVLLAEDDEIANQMAELLRKAQAFTQATAEGLTKVVYLAVTLQRIAF